MDAEHWTPYFILISFSPGHKPHQVSLLSPTRRVAGSALSTTSPLLPSWRTSYPRLGSLLKGSQGILWAGVGLHFSMPVEEVFSKFSPQETGNLILGLNIFISLWSRDSSHRNWCPQVFPETTRTTLSSSFLLPPSSPFSPQTTFWLLANVSTCSPY